MIDVPIDQIQNICSLMEGYDNLAVVRTPTAGLTTLHVYVAEPELPQALRILRDLGREIPITFGPALPGMPDLDELEWFQ